ncbi:MAG: glutamyl-tRNA(Gln) amidotransferase, subunit [Anaerosolibacter sp.]|jgi:aspartyl-tRNA(Asn)/glutamyl-tRNA(Gln) amidotransferase subunit A|uniref:Asp-tRNA(Asn)/Glu-tRNA(Gln) amidotransferase subunit GatA n=1 Tax=Anaerosolibacter sp. TaxID=1872527 RepID=UPI00261ECFE8|nr:Asp-tRNA(Asn)/Glu-tRNA(Gln) amidotransferase subunit GatA [Anaerosolibacter sp.]MDF2547422.1 glutamyl-tRNA(Gln) amidotransferase, subunit [Anaerosolibacter sp.]
MKIEELTIEEIQKAYQEKRFTVTEIVQGYLDRINKLDPQIGAFITLCKESALKEAEAIDKKLANGEDIGMLGGIPVAIKDNICTRGIKTTCASKILEDFIPPYDATVVQRLKDAGAIIIGKTNMDEFAMGSSTENSAFQKTKNPWHLDKVPGGSSGGSAAAVAAGFAPLTIGSDTGGSIRQPAAFCGAVGLKPTYGLVSRYGLVAFASSLDQVGPFTRTVKDCAISLQTIQGHDPLDTTSIQREPEKDYISDLHKGVKGLRIGIPKECFKEGLDPEIRSAIEKAVRQLEEDGAVVEEFSLPIMDSGLSAYYIISSAEASANLARYDGVRYGYRAENFTGIEELMENTRTEGFGKEVKRRIMLGTYVLSSGYYDAYYKKAMMLRQKIQKVMKQAFEAYDIILTPTSPVLPFSIGEKTADPMEMYLADIYTVNINIAGVPAISIPCGFSKEKLPIGLQLIGDHYTEKKLLQAAYSLEQGLGVYHETAFLKEAE